MEIRSPKIGYGSEAKQNYRQSVWDAMLLADKAKNKHGKVLILPSKDGEEIDYLISRGFKQSDIICIDENPALIASAPWRKKYKSIKCYGCKVSSVSERLKKDGFTIRFANLDLCNNFSEELVSEVGAFLGTAPICDSDFYFSVTVSKGREQSVTNYLMNLLMQENSWKSSDYVNMQEKRVACLMRVVSPKIPKNKIVKLIGEGSYIHHKTPMAYACFTLHDELKSFLVDGLAEKIQFQKSAYERSFLNKLVIKMGNAERYYHNIIKNIDSIEDMKSEWRELAEICESVIFGEYDESAVMAKIVLDENTKIKSTIDNLLNGALDASQVFNIGGLSHFIHHNALAPDAVSEIRWSLEMYNRVKLKYSA